MPISKKNHPMEKKATRIFISNLDLMVTAQDMRDIFEEIGPLKAVLVHYDDAYKSLGTADVIFHNAANAVKAVKKFNNVPLDGRRMCIQIM